MNRIFMILVLVAVSAVPGTVALGAPKHHAPMTVARDAAGDWGSEIDTALSPIGDALGQDLIAAAIAAHPDTVDFSLTTTSLPEGAARLGAYTWDMQVDGQWWRLVNFICDPTQYVTDGTPPVSAPDSCAPDAGAGTYFEVMECGDDRVVNAFANCGYRAVVEATVDTGASTITISVPRSVMKIKRGSLITPMDVAGNSIDSGTAAPWGGAVALPGDVMSWTKPYRVR